MNLPDMYSADPSGKILGCCVLYTDGSVPAAAAVQRDAAPASPLPSRWWLPRAAASPRRWRPCPPRVVAPAGGGVAGEAAGGPAARHGRVGYLRRRREERLGPLPAAQPRHRRAHGGGQRWQTQRVGAAGGERGRVTGNGGVKRRRTAAASVVSTATAAAAARHHRRATSKRARAEAGPPARPARRRVHRCTAAASVMAPAVWGSWARRARVASHRGRRRQRGWRPSHQHASLRKPSGHPRSTRNRRDPGQAGTSHRPPPPASNHGTRDAGGGAAQVRLLHQTQIPQPHPRRARPHAHHLPVPLRTPRSQCADSAPSTVSCKSATRRPSCSFNSTATASNSSRKTCGPSSSTPPLCPHLQRPLVAGRRRLHIGSLVPAHTLAVRVA